jgi:hypothetical protein
MTLNYLKTQIIDLKSLLNSTGNTEVKEGENHKNRVFV